MATVTLGQNVGGFAGAEAILGTAQTGNADSTNTLDRAGLTGPGLLRITTTIGATPTVTVNIVGSVDGTTFYNIPYATTGAPATATAAALTITTAATTFYHLLPDFVWRYLKLVYSANTNVTITAAVAVED